MARAIFSHEVSDPDFQWLLSNYAERKAGAFTVDVTCLPVVLVLLTEDERSKTGPLHDPLPPLPVPNPTETPGQDDTPKESE
jgi:hypothetical protein